MVSLSEFASSPALAAAIAWGTPHFQTQTYISSPSWNIWLFLPRPKFQWDLKTEEHSSPEFQKQVQKGLLALDQAVYTSLTGVPSKEQLQSEEVPVEKQKPDKTSI